MPVTEKGKNMSRHFYDSKERANNNIHGTRLSKNIIPVRITDSLQKRLFSLRLNKEKTDDDDDLPLLRLSKGAPFDVSSNS